LVKSNGVYHDFTHSLPAPESSVAAYGFLGWL
jgi:hypothetical protein